MQIFGGSFSYCVHACWRFWGRCGPRNPRLPRVIISNFVVVGRTVWSGMRVPKIGMLVRRRSPLRSGVVPDP